MPGLEGSPQVATWSFDAQGQGMLKVDRSRVPDELQDTVGVEECAHWLGEFAKRCTEARIPCFLMMNPNIVEAYRPGYTASEDKATVRQIQAARNAGMRTIDPSLEILAFLRSHGLSSRDQWVTPHASDAHPVPTRHVLMAKEMLTVLGGAGVLPESVTTQSVMTGREWLDSEAARQWQITLAHDCPRSSPKAYEVRFTDPKPDGGILGEGWYDKEFTRTKMMFRWTRPEAQLKLPPCKQAAFEISTEWPKQVAPPKYRLTVQDTELTYTVKARNLRAWMVFEIPPELQSRPLDVRLHCPRLEIPGIAQDRDLGLRVYAIMIDPVQRQMPGARGFRDSRFEIRDSSG